MNVVVFFFVCVRVLGRIKLTTFPGIVSASSPQFVFSHGEHKDSALTAENAERALKTCI